ncbi:hypothetical protein TSMEX_010433 [Taenia solium]|eukprot:TsM_000876900 transcript=TsM_000876900 gene=TsM_000876900
MFELLGPPSLWVLEKSTKLEPFFKRINNCSAAVTTSATASTAMTNLVSSTSVSASTSVASAACFWWTEFLIDTTFSLLQGKHADEVPPSRFTHPRSAQGPRLSHWWAARQSIEGNGHASKDDNKFIHLVLKMLVNYSQHRTKPDDALTHSSFGRESSAVPVSSAATFTEGHPMVNTMAPSAASANGATIVAPSQLTPTTAGSRKFAWEVPPPTSANASRGEGSLVFPTCVQSARSVLYSTTTTAAAIAAGNNISVSDEQLLKMRASQCRAFSHLSPIP